MITKGKFFQIWDKYCQAQKPSAGSKFLPAKNIGISESNEEISMLWVMGEIFDINGMLIKIKVISFILIEKGVAKEYTFVSLKRELEKYFFQAFDRFGKQNIVFSTGILSKYKNYINNTFNFHTKFVETTGTQINQLEESYCSLLDQVIESKPKQKTGKMDGTGGGTEISTTSSVRAISSNFESNRRFH